MGVASLSADEIRRFAQRAKDAAQARRLYMRGILRGFGLKMSVVIRK